jgi:hypothetical protein
MKEIDVRSAGSAGRPARKLPKSQEFSDLEDPRSPMFSHRDRQIMIWRAAHCHGRPWHNLRKVSTAFTRVHHGTARIV